MVMATRAFWAFAFFHRSTTLCEAVDVIFMNRKQKKGAVELVMKLKVWKTDQGRKKRDNLNWKASESN